MRNIKPLMKRVCAYALDLFFVIILSSIVSSIPALNKNMEDYQQTYDEYVVEYNTYSEYLTLLNDLYKDEEINEEDYTKLIESTEYKDIVISKYKDNKISKKEYKDIVSEINDKFDLVVKEYDYILSKKSVSNSIITLVCTILYFGVFQYFMKGQTIGKKILKLKVVSSSEKKLNILTYLLESLIVNDVLLNSIGIIFLVLSSKTIYINADKVIGIIISLVEALIIFLVLTREDERGLHDLLLNTKVISTSKNKTELKEENIKVIDAVSTDKKENK